MQKKTKIGLGISLLALLFIGAGVAFYLMHKSIKEKEEAISVMSAQFELEKEQLTDEYSQLSLQYEGYGLRVGNDSLANLLDQQRYKVQRLLEELRTVKASNVKRINQLKDELSTLRAIMRQYVIQIDSLNTLTHQLRTENKVVTQKYTAEQEKTQTLLVEKKELVEKVTLASILEVSNISIESLTNKGKIATKIRKASQLKFSFVINKNISASTGEKYVYVRILQPDETPLVKKNDNVFFFENKYINYSARRPVEYDGEALPVTIFWDIEEFLIPGNYRIDIFTDGYLIGTKKFVLKD